MVTPDVKRNAVAHVCAQHGVSQRRACEVLSFDRSSMRYRSVRPDDAAIREAMKKVASERRRFGYRRIHVMLDRQGIVMNLKKLRRLYREEKLTVRKRGGRKRALGTRRPLALPSRPNERSALPRAGQPHCQVRQAKDDCLRQWHGNDQHGHSQMVPRDLRRMALHCPRQADAKRFRRELHVWTAPALQGSR